MSALLSQLLKLIKETLSKVQTYDDIKRILKYIIGLSIFYYWYKNLRCRKHDSIPMFPEWNPIIGHTTFGRRNWHRLNQKLYECVKQTGFPPVLAASGFLPLYAIFLLDPDVVKLVFDKEFNKFEKGERIQMESKELLGNGIFASDPPEWTFHRKVASRMFSTRNLKDYMFDCTILHTKHVITKINEQGDDMNNVDVYDLLGRFTLDAFTSMAFGKSCDSLSLYPDKHPFAESFDILIEAIALRHVTPRFIWKPMRWLKWGNEKVIYENIKVINNFADQVLDSRQTELSPIIDESGDKYNDIISLFIKHEKSIKSPRRGSGAGSNSKSKLTKKELKDIAMNMIIAGRDTTRLLMTWFLYEMCKRPEIKAKIYKEMDEYAANNNVNEMSYESIINSMFYLESVLLESLRLNPVVPFLIRHAKQDVQLPNGQWIRKLNEVVIPTYVYARNPKIYKDPLKFDPHRFYDKCIQRKIDPLRVFDVYKFPFFNINPRLCLGRKLALMECKVFLFYFFQNYEFEMADPNQKIEIKTGIVLNMKEGLRLKVTKRVKK